MSLVQRRILEHLGAAGVLLLIGCHKPEAPAPAQDATVPAGTAAEPAPSATVGATATAVAPAVGPGGADVGGVCKTADDCKPGLHCQLEFDGASFSETGVCSTERPVYRGRPLYVEGVARMASIALGDATRDGDAWAAHFARAAVEEHASVAAFARTLCQLMALGAPLELLERTQRALCDEIDHTRGSLGWLAHFGGGEAAPGPLPEAVSPLSANAGLEALARELVLDDEARHAALAFETALWLVREHPSLASIVERECALLEGEARRIVGPLFEATSLSAKLAA
jgi:hypothetical protein